MRTRHQLRKTLLAVMLVLTSAFFPLPALSQAEDNDPHRQVPGLDLLILVDESETMWNTTDVQGVRVNTVNLLIDMLASEQSGPGHRLGIIAFGTQPQVIPFTPLDSQLAAEQLKEQYAAIHQEIETHKDQEYTDINQALQAALDLIQEEGLPDRKQAVILVSDGQPTNPQVNEKKGQDVVVAYLNQTRELLSGLREYPYTERTCPSPSGAPLYIIGIGTDKLTESSTPEFITLYREFWQGMSARTSGYYKEADQVQDMQSISTYIFSELLCTPATPSLAVRSPQILEYQVHNSYYQIFFTISGKENPDLVATVYRPQEDGSAGGEELSKDEEGVSWQSNGIDYEVWGVRYTEPWSGTWSVVLGGEGRADFSYVYFPKMTILLEEPGGSYLPADRPLTIRARVIDETGQTIDVLLKDFQAEIEGADGLRKQLSLEKEDDTYVVQFDAPGETGEHSLILNALLPDGTPLYEHKWITFISAPWVEITDPGRNSSHEPGQAIPLEAKVHLAGATSFEDIKLIATLLEGDESIQTVEMSRGDVSSETGENLVAYSGEFQPLETDGEYAIQAEMIAILPGGRVFDHETIPLPLRVVSPPTPTPSPSPTVTPHPTATSTPSPAVTPTATATLTPTPVPLLASVVDSPLCLPGILILLLLICLLALWGLLRRKRYRNVPDKIKLLAELMSSRRESDEPPYVLILGSGPSVTLGNSSMRRVVKGVAGVEDMEKFYETLDGLSPVERYVILKKHFAEAGISSGYRQLADLIKKGYFDVIFTTNLDPFLENVLNGGKLDENDLKIFVCGEQRSEEILHILETTQPRVKIFKLHGDVSSRSFAFTPSEISLFGSEGERLLRMYLNRDLIIVGHGPRDYDVSRAVEREGGSIWYVNHTPPPTEDMVSQAMRARGAQSNIISGEFGLFDNFFEALHDELTH